VAQPTIIELRHNLGRDEVRRRMSSRVGDLHRHVPGGMATVTSHWSTADCMAVNVRVMGQDIPCTLDVEDDLVRATIMLPELLSLMARPIAGIVRQQGEALLLDETHRSEVQID
jgi:hypothetical protein